MSHRNILVVEDDGAIREGLRDLLRGEGYNVTALARGREALKKSRSRPHHLLLLDVNLPDINGFEICRQIRARRDDVPIMFITARGETVDRIVGLEAGADDYIVKPFNAQEVLARVRARLRVGQRVRRAEKSAQREKRSLQAIMFTDMIGFSRAMHDNEDQAMLLLRRQNACIERSVHSHKGTIVEIIGDAFLVTFASAVQAVRCGLAILQAIKNDNRGRRGPDRCHVRIGIHLGDVQRYKKGIRGDAVNIAARLQQLAQPDSIALSASIYDAIHGKITVRLRKIGVRRVKNISTPIAVYSITGNNALSKQ